MKFNVNDYVKIKLTPLGHEILKKEKIEYLAKEDKDGWSRWQLLVLMETFGNYTHNGFLIPFETEIEIEEI